jgi:hypothetical protein
MPEDRFDIYFSGALIEGQDPAAARERIARMFKASDAQLERLFSGTPVAVKRDVDLESASRYRLAFRQAGALVEIRPRSQSQAPTPAAGVADERAPMTLMPPNTGSLEEFAPSVQAAPLPDTSALHMSPPGTEIDETPRPPPAGIDTGELALVDGQDWSLEDCQPAALPLVLPDISDIKLAPPGEDMPRGPEPDAPPLPDISEMRLLDREEEKPD